MVRGILEILSMICVIHALRIFEILCIIMTIQRRIKIEKKELSETARLVLLAIAVVIDFALMITSLALYLFY